MYKTHPPAIVNVCVVRGVCPGKCPHCPVGATPLSSRPGRFGYGFADWRLFEKICREAAQMGPQKPLIRIHGVGEPTLWPELKRALSFCHECELNTWVFTIGVGPKREVLIDTLLRASIVEFSINAFEPGYFAATKGLKEEKFWEILQTIRVLDEHRRAGPVPLQRILVSMVESGDASKEQKFVEFWQNTGWVDDAFVRKFHDYGGRVKDEHGLLGTLQSKGCLVPFARMNVDVVLGVVVRCFNELFNTPNEVEKRAICKVSERTLKEIWFGPEMEQWRDNPFSYDECANCRSCQFFHPNTSEKQIRMLK